jgi:hypothetical protein
MADRLAENGAIQYALANPKAGSKRAALSGYIMGALNDWLRNPFPPLSRLAAPGRLRGKFFDSGLAPLAMDFTSGQYASGSAGTMAMKSFSDIVTFSRTSNATVTKSDGTIGYAPHNLLTFSEQFDNAAWTKTELTVSANQAVAPNGTSTADRIIESTTALATHVIFQSAGSATVHSLSFYFKPNGRSWVNIRIDGTSNYFNITTGALGTIAGGNTATIISAGDGWYRCAIAKTMSGSGAVGLRLASADNTDVYTGDGTSGIFIWGAQLEVGASPTAYNPTTVKNLLGFTEAFDNAAWTKSNSFVQTNLLTYSEAFDNAAWTKTTITATANTIIAPNGYQTADTLAATGANSTALQTFTAAAVPYTYSVYLYRKTGTGDIDITVDGTTWVTKAITAGWTRVDTTLTPAAGSKTAGIRIVTSGDEVYAWGAQLVQGSVAGDYRRTDAAALPVFYANHNGVICAEQLHGTAANGTILESYTATGGSMTFSIWMRRITGTGNVDITMDTGSTWTTQAITTDWVRYSITTSPTAGARTAGIRLVTSGDVIQVFGAMVSDSASLDPYVLNAAAAPSAQAYYGARFDYDPVTLAPKGLLIEEQRTNLLLQSENLGTTWINTESSETLNVTTSPDGTVDADKLVENTATNFHAIEQTVTSLSAVVHTFSVYAKYTERNIQIFFGFNDVTGNPHANFDLQNGTVGTTSGTITASIQSVGNGWYRCIATITSAVTSDFQCFVNLISSTSAARAASYTGDGTSGAFLWGAQLEAGAFATSYIPTAASAVTRAADIAVIQGSNFYSWYNQNANSLYARFDSPASGNRNIIAVDDGSANNHVKLRTEGTDPYVRSAYVGSEVVALDLGTVAANTAYKIAVGYSINNYAGVINAGTVGTDTSATTPIASLMRLGTDQAGAYLNGHLYAISSYNSNLPASTLSGITA